MKKTNFLLSAFAGVGITVGLLGCGSDGVNPPLASQSQAVPVRMVATYDVSGGNIPLPNDLLFSGTTDLTLNIPVVDPTDYSDPKVALSGLDGWSGLAPFAINFSSLDTALSVDAASVAGNIHVYEVNVFRPDINFGQVDPDTGEPLPEAGIIAPSGPVTSVIRELVFGQEYVAQVASATSVAIVPIVPFTPQHSYMVVATNGLTDSNGLAILHDSQYAISQSATPIASNSSVAGLEPVRQLVNAMETAAAAVEGGPARSSIILSFQFTVQSVGTVMQTAKAVYIDGAIGAGQTPVTSFTSLGTDTTPFTGAPTSAVNLYKGQITLNYMLGIQSAENPTAPLNTFWRTAEYVPDGQGGAFANPDPLGNLTYANPLPQINGQETVPLLVSIPKSDQCAKPYAVAIFQHGITANRTNLIGIADSLGQACIAAVAMDMPLHGLAADDPTGLYEGVAPGGLRERTMGLDFIDNATGAPGPDGIADPSGTHTINLTNLLVARDNNREAIFDLLYLEKALAFMDIDGDSVMDFDMDKVSFIGHSLGGIVGSSFVAYSDNIKAAVLANPGGGTANLLNASLAFGPRIRAGIAAAAGMDPADPAFAPVLAQFLFATQTVVDSSDPVNTAAIANANGVPTLMLQVANDSVVPNMVTTAPLSGTEPLARLLGLTTTAVSAESNTVVGARLFTKLNQGLHSSVLTPADATGDPVGLINVTTEMQTEIVSFLATGGTAVQVGDPTLLAQ